MSLSNLLRWGNKKTAAPAPPKKEMARAEEAELAPISERRRSIRWPKGGSARMLWIAEDGSSKTMTVWLKNVGDGGIGVVSRKPIGTDRAVWVMTEEGHDWQGMIRYCNHSEEGFQVGFERIKPKPSKSEPAGGTQLKWVDKSGKQVRVPVSVRNAGDGRIEVVSAKSVLAPTIALLAGKEFRCLASALACHKRGGRFLVEMEVVTDTYRHPEPAHA